MSTFNERPERVGPDHLEPLLRHALDFVPRHAVPETPIFLLATAGMRLLPDVQRDELLRRICSYVRLNSDFLLPDCGLHVQAISGETEGIYGWLAANYLLGAFDAAEGRRHGKGHRTYGFLDMGGASAQIAFAPNATEAEKHADDLQLVRLRTLNGESKEYGVFVTTWLGFGVHQARRRYVEALLEASATHDARELPDPCLPVGLVATTDGDPLEPGSEEAKRHEPYLIGTGRFDECLRQTYPLLDKDAPCEDRPCLLHGVHVPAIDFDVNHFVGVSEYWHTTHEVFQTAHKDKAYDFDTYQKRVRDFCSQDWKTVAARVRRKEWGKKVDERTAAEVCFKASWMTNVLHDGIGIPRVGLESTKPGGLNVNGTQDVVRHARAKPYPDAFQAVDKIRDVEVSWTLGKMVLYAASQIPSATDVLPVGFGSNTVPLPSDFQYAGSRHAPDVNVTAGADDEADGWSRSILDSESPRRVPGFLLFLAIVGIVGLIWCRKDRRARCYRRLAGSFGRRGGHKRRRVLGGKLFGGAAPAVYERVLEDADGRPDIELGGDSDNDLSDSSGKTHVGRTSGWATPQLSVTLEHATHTSYFDHHVPAPKGVGLGIGLAAGAEGGGGEQGGGGGAGASGGGGGGHPQPHHHHHHHHHKFASSAMNRSGLVGRTESRDRLFSAHAGTGGGGGGGGGGALGAAGSVPSTSNLGLSLGLAGGSGSHSGRRSRATSPVRHKTPLMTPRTDEFD